MELLYLKLVILASEASIERFRKEGSREFGIL
jgi:hypothetical protein